MRSAVLLLLAIGLSVFGQGFAQKPSAAKTPFDWAGLRPPFNHNLGPIVTLNAGQTLLFKRDQYALYNRSTGQFTTGAITSLPGWPKGWQEVDAAARWTDTKVLLFNGGSWILYDLEKRGFSQSGDITGWSGWPSGWASGIDAALDASDATLYLFRGNQYITVDKASGRVSAGPRSVQDWKGWPSHWIDGIDSADNPGDGYIYFFRGSEILAYDLKKAHFVKGYPKQLPGAQPETAQSWPPLDPNTRPTSKRPLEWKNLPPPFNAGIRAAVSIDKERILLFKDDKYALYFHHRDDKGIEADKVQSSGSLASILPTGWTTVHAAAKWNDSSIVLFHEGRYVRYDLRDRTMGREQKLSNLAGWPAAWIDGIDAALADDDGDTLYLFRGPTYLTVSKSQLAVIVPPAPISDWTGLPGEWLDGIDGADNPGDGRWYFFRDGQVLAWDVAGLKCLDGYPKDLPGAPKPAAKVWPPIARPSKPYGAARGQRALLKFAGVAPALKAGIDAGAAIGGDNILLFSGSQYVIYNGKSGAISKPADLKNTKGWPSKWTKVDAAAAWDDITLLLFSGGEFIQYNMQAEAFRGTAEPVTDIPNWPAGWTDGINGACNLSDDTLYLFHGSAYVMMSKSYALVISAPQSAKTWQGWPKTWTAGPTATVEAPDGHVYFFHGSEYLPYDPDRNTFVAKAPQQLPGAMGELALVAFPPVAAPLPEPPEEADGADSGLSASTGKAVIRYSDDYPVNNDFEWEIPWMSKGADYLGSGYDPLTVDPANYGDVSTRAPFQAVGVTTSFHRNPDGSLAGYCTRYSPGDTGVLTKDNSLVNTLSEFQNHFGISGSVSGGVPGASMSVGGGYKTFNSQKNGREEVYELQQSTIGLARLQMDLTCIDIDSNKPYRQKLDPRFRNAVKKLEDPTQWLAGFQPKWLADSQSLSALQGWYTNSALASSNYMQLLKDYGFVFANSVTMGGQFRSTLTITKTQAESISSNEEDFNTEMEGTLDEVTIGASLDINNGSLAKSSKDTADLSAKIETSGGVPNSDYDTWAQSIVSLNAGINGSTTTGGAPVPVQAQFEPLSDLLSSDFFPDDPKIADKAKLLLDLIDAHMLVDAAKYPIVAAPNLNAFFTSAPRQYKVSLVSIAFAGGNMANITLSQKLAFTILDGDANEVTETVIVPPLSDSAAGTTNGGQFPPGTYTTDAYRFFDVGSQETYPLGQETKPANEFVYLQAPKGYYVHFYGVIYDYSVIGSQNPSYSEISQNETAIDPSQDVDLGALNVGDSKTVSALFTSSSQFNLANTITVTFRVERTQ